jgi:hypothetical protein
MTRNCYVLTLAAALTLAVSAQAEPFFTEPGIFQTGTAPNTFQGNVFDAAGGASSGTVFSNTTTTTNPAAGGTVISVGANLLANYDLGGGGTASAQFNGQQLVLVVATKGISFPVGGGVTQAIFNQGYAAVFGIPAGTFNRYNPATWGAVASLAGSGFLNTPLAVFQISTTASSVTPGAGSTIFNLVGTPPINTSAVNAVAGVDLPGNFVFPQVPKAADGQAASPTTFFQVPFLPPSGFTKTSQGLVIRTDQAVDTSPNLGFISGGPGTTGFDELNVIAKLLAGLPDLGSSAGVGTSFATGFGPATDTTPTDFSPSTTLPLTNSDFVGGFGTTSAPVVGLQSNTPATVPEPASLLLWGSIGIGFGYCRYRRRRQSRTTVVT